MKNSFIPLIFLGICGLGKSQITISHSQIPFKPIIGLSLACNGPGNNFSFENIISRSFFLNDFDIQNDFQIHKVSFSIQNVIFLPADGFPVTVSLFTSKGAYPNGELTLIGTAEAIVTKDTSHTIELDLEAVAPAGSEVVMKVRYDGKAINSTLFLGVNGYTGDTAPSYFQASACGIYEPLEVGEIQDAGNSRHLFSIEGEDIFLGNVEVINSSKITVYPNPVEESFSLKLDNSIKIIQSELFDLTGKSLKTFGNKTTDLNISNLPKGLYLLKIRTQNGKSFNQKLIKK